MKRSQSGGDLLAIAFGATVAMWAMLYVAAMPPGYAILRIIAAVAIVVCLFAAGYVAGRRAGRGWAGGAGVGVIATAVSLLVLLSLIGGQTRDTLLPALWWILGFLGTAVVLGAIGAAIGNAGSAALEERGNWTAALALITAVTGLLMLIAGGIVTGLEAGLAVEGWLIAEGHVLVLFPISVMQRDVGTFAEHAHRLWGLLLGLTTLVLMARMWMSDSRAWTRWLSVAIVAAVVGQGVLGGTRVTEQSVTLAIIHGVFAHVILATLVALAAATTSAWLSDEKPAPMPSAGTDRTLGVLLLAAILLQIVMGTMYRHLQPDETVSTGLVMGLLHGHSFLVSVLVVVLALAAGLRAWGFYRAQRPIKVAGLALLHVIFLQLVLGVAAFVVVPKEPGARAEIPTLEVVITTLHQANGAVVLATALVLFAWQRRLLAAAPGGSAETT
jgi:cytochrome c oxidase assembly protein subunit 15